MEEIKEKIPQGNMKQIEGRWSKRIIDPGFTALPNIILDKQAALGLKAMDINIIMQIAKHWWSEGTAPYPSVDTIATTIGVTRRTVQKHVAAMEKKGLIERGKRFYAKGGQMSNAYTFKGLIAKCGPFADEVVKERSKKKAAEKARLKRKTPMDEVDKN